MTESCFSTKIVAAALAWIMHLHKESVSLWACSTARTLLSLMNAKKSLLCLLRYVQFFDVPFFLIQGHERLDSVRECRLTFGVKSSTSYSRINLSPPCQTILPRLTNEFHTVCALFSMQLHSQLVDWEFLLCVFSDRWLVQTGEFFSTVSLVKYP